MKKNYYKNIDDDEIENGENVFVSKTSDDKGRIVLGVFAAFGNSEYAIIEKDEALEVIEKIKRAIGD